MKKFLSAAALVATMLCGSVSASAAPVVWTLSGIAFDRDGFQTNYLHGSFTYDAATNIFSNVNLGFGLKDSCCRVAGIVDATSTASSLDIFTVNYFGSTGHLDLASPLTDAGGSISLTSGSFQGNLRAGQFITAPITAAVPEPATWALMIGGFALAGAAMRRQRNGTRVAIV